MVRFLAFLLISITFISADNWIELAQCTPWTYVDVDDWDTVTCSAANLCETGQYQSPVKISSQYTVTDGNATLNFPLDRPGTLQALNFTGYGPGTMTIHYDGNNLWADYLNQGTFSNPGEGAQFQTVSISFTTHNEQLLFSGINWLSLDITHYETGKTWNTYPVGTQSVSVLSMYFKVGNASTFLDPLFQAMATLISGKNRPPGTQNVTATWGGLSQEFEQLKNASANGYFNFDGSLTQPPCSETVEWFIFDFEWEISNQQLQILQNLVGTNLRPVQRQLAKVDFFDPLIGQYQPFSFSNISNGSIGAIILAILFVCVAALAIFFGINPKNNNNENFATY